MFCVLPSATELHCALTPSDPRHRARKPNILRNNIFALTRAVWRAGPSKVACWSRASSREPAPMRKTARLTASTTPVGKVVDRHRLFKLDGVRTKEQPKPTAWPLFMSVPPPNPPQHSHLGPNPSERVLWCRGLWGGCACRPALICLTRGVFAAH